MLKYAINLLVVIGLVKYSSYLLESGWMDVLFGASIMVTIFFLGLFFFEKFFYLIQFFVVVLLAYNLGFIGLTFESAANEAILNACVKNDMVLYEVECLSKHVDTEHSPPMQCVTKLDKKRCATLAFLFTVGALDEKIILHHGHQGLVFDELSETIGYLMKYQNLNDLIRMDEVTNASELLNISEYDCLKDLERCFSPEMEEIHKIRKLGWANSIWSIEVFRKLVNEANYCSKVLGESFGLECALVQNLLYYYVRT